MTATLNAIRNKLLLCSVLCFILGAILFAPCVNATDLTDDTIVNASPETVAQSIIDHYNLDEDNCVYMYRLAFNDWYRVLKPYYQVVVFETSSDLSFTTGDNNGSPIPDTNYPYDITDCNSRFYYVSWGSNGVEYFSCVGNSSPFSSNGTFYSNLSNRAIVDHVNVYTYTNPVIWYANFDVSSITHNDNFVTFNSISPPVETTEQTYSDVLLQGYLHENDIDVDKATAWIILYSGEPIQIPISYSEPTNYSGDFYVKQTSATPYLDKFSVVAVNPDYDLSRYRGARVCIKYPFNATTLKLYGLYADTPADHEPTIAFDPTLPQGSNYVLNQLNGVPGLYDFTGKTYYGRLLTMSDTVNVDYPVYISWDMWLDPLSAIPHTHSLLVGIDLTVTDSNGDTTIGRDTTNYNNYVTNYNNEAIAGLTGTISGRTRFEADWRGQNVNTEIHYSSDDDFQIDDDETTADILSMFFELGDGILLELSIGVLSIAFASYILFGKH